MKTLGTVLKILAALAAIAGVVYVVATYGDKIVAWAKKLLGRLGCCCACDCGDEVDAVCAEEEALDEAPVEDGAVQADDKDFEG